MVRSCGDRRKEAPGLKKRGVRARPAARKLSRGLVKVKVRDYSAEATRPYSKAWRGQGTRRRGIFDGRLS
jgi:hypothetical protein